MVLNRDNHFQQAPIISLTVKVSQTDNQQPSPDKAHKVKLFRQVLCL